MEEYFPAVKVHNKVLLTPRDDVFRVVGHQIVADSGVTLITTTTSGKLTHSQSKALQRQPSQNISHATMHSTIEVVGHGLTPITLDPSCGYIEETLAQDGIVEEPIAVSGPGPPCNDEMDFSLIAWQDTSVEAELIAEVKEIVFEKLMEAIQLQLQVACI